MFKQVPPSRLRLLAVTLAVVTAVSAGAALPLISSAPPSFLDIASTTHTYAVIPKEVPGALSTGFAAGSAKGSAATDGGTIFNFGVVNTVALPPGSEPVGVASDSANGNVYVTDSHFDLVREINGSTQQLMVNNWPVGFDGSNPSGVVYDSSNSDVYVANFSSDGGGNVVVISTTSNQVVSDISVSGGPVGLAYDSLTGNVYVTGQYTNSISEIPESNGPAFNTVVVGDLPIAIAFDPANGNLYVANAGSANVSVVNTNTNKVTDSIPVGLYPIGVAYDRGNGDVYVTNWHSDNVTVINGTTEKFVTSVSVGSFPVGVAYDPVHSVVAVAAEDDGQVNFISNSTNALIGNVTVGSKPVGIAYDPINHDEYVTNANSSNVSVLSTALAPPYAVTFTETGLPTGTSWSATLAGTTKPSTSGSIIFSETNGSYPFTVSPIAGYTVSPSSGTVKVDGFPFPISVTFTPVEYAVTFTESGLPTGTLWTATLNGTPGTSKASTLVFNEPNGTYPFAVGAVGFSAGPSSGQVPVNGAPAYVAVTFTAIGVTTYVVTFTESGLPSGATWSVTLNGTLESLPESSLTFTEPNGAYPYSVGTVSGYNATPLSGTVTVSGGPVGVSVSFTSGPSTSSTSASGTPLWVYALVAVIIAAVVIGTVLFLRRRRPPAPSSTPSPSTPGTPPTSQ